LLFEGNTPDEIFEINDPPDTIFPMRDIYIPVLAQLFHGVDIHKISRPVASIRKRFPFMPTISGNILNGQVTYVDNYDNIFTNIHRTVFDKARQKNSRFTLYIGGSYSRYPDLKISDNFQNAGDSGAIVVFFVNNYLVIAMKHGAAARLLGGSEGETVMLEF
jgi:S-adenosylmethionine hydrolase